MQKVVLYAQGGGFVVKGLIPPFNEQPDVLIWGERFFVPPAVDWQPTLQNSIPENVLCYVEAFTVALVQVE